MRVLTTFTAAVKYEDDLSDGVITSAAFHKSDCNTFAYGDSKGEMHMMDIREWSGFSSSGISLTCEYSCCFE